MNVIENITHLDSNWIFFIQNLCGNLFIGLCHSEKCHFCEHFILVKCDNVLCIVLSTDFITNSGKNLTDLVF